MSNIEETSLEAHVRICQERYERLDYKLDVIDEKFANLDVKLAALAVQIESLKSNVTTTKINGGIYIIGILLSALGFLVAKFVI